MTNPILEQIRADQGPGESRCHTCGFLRDLPPDQRPLWAEALAEPSLTDVGVARAMTRISNDPAGPGHPIGAGSVHAHRQGGHR